MFRCWRRHWAVRLGITDPAKSLASDRVWHLGRIDWHGQLRDVVLARGIARKGAEDLVPVFANLLKPIVFVPDERPAPDYWGRAAPPVVALSAIALLGANGIELTRRVLTATVAQAEDQSQAAYVFLLKGEFWQITFEGETQYFKDSVGLAQHRSPRCRETSMHPRKHAARSAIRT